MLEILCPLSVYLMDNFLNALGMYFLLQDVWTWPTNIDLILSSQLFLSSSGLVNVGCLVFWYLRCETVLSIVVIPHSSLAGEDVLG